MNPSRTRRWLIAVLTAVALSCLASANAIAQTVPLRLGTVSGVSLNLAFPVTSGGKTYYYLDKDNNGETSSFDQLSHNDLDTLLNDGSDTTDTLDTRSVITDGYTLILPTISEWRAFQSVQGTPAKWSNSFYLSATRDSAETHAVIRLSDGTTFPDDPDASVAYTAFQVLPITALTFDTSIISTPNSAYTYNVSRTVTLSLPPATGGLVPLRYTLTGDIPDGLEFSTATRTLAGTPTTETDTVTLTYMVTDSTETTATLTFMVTVLSGEFITTWQISPGSENNRTITIPIHADSNYRYTVDWGDETDDTEIYTSSTIGATHTYSTPATTTSYKVTITGVFPRIYFNSEGDKDKIISIDQWGNNLWDSMESAFWGCGNLGYTAKDTPDLSQVTDMSHMFRGAAVFNGDIGNWDVSNVTNMQNMFSRASVFNQDIGDWDVSNVTNMETMFSSALKFNQNIGDWDVSKVTNMESIFSFASLFNQDIGDWDVSNVTNMANMFIGASAFNQDISDWKVGNVIHMGAMFSGARKFNQNISQWEVNKVTGMSGMFFSANAFNQDISQWKVGNVTNMANMFEFANKFNQDIGDWDVSNVIEMSHMFEFASAFDQDIGRWKVNNVTDMDSMFEFASAFDQDIGGWDVGKVTNMRDMFADATLSIDNYDALLAGWSKLELQSSVSFSAGNSQHCNQPARDILTVRYEWIISGDNPADNCSLTFGTETIPDQNYNVGRPVSVTLTEAYGGTDPLNYTLTSTDSIPAELDFTTATRTLAGTPTATAAVTLTYTVTDSVMATAALTFMVTVTKRQQTGFAFTDATVRKTIEDTDPFTLTPNGGSGSGAVTYESSDTPVATVDPNSGEVTIVAIGETTITATKAGDANYNLATASYTLIVTAAAALLFRIKAFLEGAQ